MAFGIERVQQSVTNIRYTLGTMGETMRSGFDRIAAAITDSQRDISARIDAIEESVRSLRGEAEASRRALEASVTQGVQAEGATARLGEELSPGEPGEDVADYRNLLELAAVVACSKLVCHRDTWAFVVEQAAQAEHFRLPAGIDERADGTIEADISGRTLIAVIGALWRTQHSPVSEETGALAKQVYRRIHEALQGLAPAESGAQRVTRVLIDDRPRPGGSGGDPLDDGKGTGALTSLAA